MPGDGKRATMPGEGRDGMKWSDGPPMSRTSAVFFIACMSTVAGGAISSSLGHDGLFALMRMLALILFPGLLVSHAVDRRRYRLELQQRLAANLPRCPPDFHAPRFVAPAELPS